MSEIINISSYLPSIYQPRELPDSKSPIGDSAPLVRDRVEISPRGRLLAETSASSSFRTAKTQAIRAEIEAGTYETPERIEGTVARILDVIG